MIAEKLFVSSRRVKALCGELGVEPLGIQEYNLKFLKENCNRLSRSQAAGYLRMTSKSLYELYEYKYKLVFLPEDQAKQIDKIGISPREVLSGFRLGDAHHYHYPELDPVQDQITKLHQDLERLKKVKK